MNTTPTSEIICTKSQFRAALAHEFAAVMADTAEVNMSEVREAIDELVRQADNTRGVFSGYSDYLDLAYVVAPDARCDKGGGAHISRCAAGDSCEWYAPGLANWKADVEASEADSPDALTIPSVTDEQRAQAREAASATIREAIRTLNGTAAMLREHANDPQVIDTLARDIWELANVLQAAAGHLRIAQL